MLVISFGSSSICDRSFDLGFSLLSSLSLSEKNTRELSSCLNLASVIIKHFIIQPMHNIQYVDTIKIIKYLKVLPTCFGSQRIHHQGALYCAWVKITRMILSCLLTWTKSVLWQHIVTVVRVCSSLYMKD